MYYQIKKFFFPSFRLFKIYLLCTLQAYNCYVEALRVQPTLPVAWSNLAGLFMETGDYNKALQCYKVPWCYFVQSVISVRREEKNYDRYNLWLKLYIRSFFLFFISGSYQTQTYMCRCLFKLRKCIQGKLSKKDCTL